MQISITVPGCVHRWIAQERQEEEEGTPHTVVFEKEEGEEEDRGLRKATTTTKTMQDNAGRDSVTDRSVIGNRNQEVETTKQNKQQEQQI